MQKHGIYNQNLQAVPPTGSISYINYSTSSIHPVASKIEIRKEGKIGRVYYPAPYLTNDNLEYYQDAYEIGYEKIIDTYAAATQHVDQGLSLTLFFKDTATTRDVNKAQIYAWRKGIKTLYYIRLRQMAWREPKSRVRQLHAVRLRRQCGPHTCGSGEVTVRCVHTRPRACSLVEASYRWGD